MPATTQREPRTIRGHVYACPTCGRQYTATGREGTIGCTNSGRHRHVRMRQLADTGSSS